MVGYFEIGIAFATALFILLYRYITSTYSFWEKRGVHGPKPIPLLGNSGRAAFRLMSIGQYINDLYTKYKKEPVIGIYTFTEPILITIHPEVIKSILIRDFPKFADRGFVSNEKADPLDSSLFLLEPERWRALRSKFSPVFTTGRLKEMFLMIVECSKRLEPYIKKIQDQPVEIHDLTARYAIDVIGTCAFGVDAKALKDEDSEFRRMGKRVFQPNSTKVIRLRLQHFWPSLGDLIGYLFPDSEVDQFFIHLTMSTIKYRKENNIVRHDFVNTLMEIYTHPENIEIELTDNLIASQAFVFFIAGFETSSSTMSHALYELAQNHVMQNKLRKEIIETYTKSNGNLYYENIQEMKYLDAIFRETLRKYPVIPVLTRESTCDYTFEGLNISIPKGQKVWIPMQGLHHDPDIYPNPEVFDPERFSSSAMAHRDPMYFLPFGEGPRNCIGKRFGVFLTKVGLIQIIRNFIVDVCDKTEIPYEPDPKGVALSPRNGIYLKVSEIQKN